MEIATTDHDGMITRAVLTGKLDIAGADVVSMPLATLSGSKQGLIIDMSGVTFISSIGIRHLVMAAKALSRRNGILVLLKPTPMVAEVLTTTGITEILPIVETDAEAMKMMGK
jgi:anti-anti-sigma factor